MSWIADQSRRIFADAASRFRLGVHEEYRLHRDTFDKAREEFEHLVPTFFKLAECYQTFLLSHNTDADAEKRGRELILHHVPPAAFGLRAIESRLRSAGLASCVERVAAFQSNAMELLEKANFDAPKITTAQLKDLLGRVTAAKEQALKALSGRG